MSGKTGSAYNEALRVPLIVVDPTGRFTGDIDIVRTQLTSSVDFLPLIVSLGHNGSTKWMRGDLNRLYRHRYNMLPLLRHAHPRGRPYVLFATDEASQPVYNFLNAPMHIVGLRTVDAKLAAYVNWKPGTTEIDLDGPMELEFYDYLTPAGPPRSTTPPTPFGPLAC